LVKVRDYGDDVYRHLKQYFSYIVAVSLLVEEAGVPGERKTTDLQQVTD
jgi:hypothetical protein